MFVFYINVCEAGLLASSGLFNTQTKTKLDLEESCDAKINIFARININSIESGIFRIFLLLLKISFPASPQFTRTAAHYYKVGYVISSWQCRHTRKCDLFFLFLLFCTCFSFFWLSYFLWMRASSSSRVCFRHSPLVELHTRQTIGGEKRILFYYYSLLFKGLIFSGTCYSSDFIFFRMTLNQFFSHLICLRMHVPPVPFSPIFWLFHFLGDDDNDSRGKSAPCTS